MLRGNIDDAWYWPRRAREIFSFNSLFPFTFSCLCLCFFFFIIKIHQDLFLLQQGSSSSKPPTEHVCERVFFLRTRTIPPFYFLHLLSRFCCIRLASFLLTTFSHDTTVVLVLSLTYPDMDGRMGVWLHPLPR